MHDLLTVTVISLKLYEDKSIAMHARDLIFFTTPSV